KEIIELLIEGGKATPGPTTAPKLSAYKLNIGEVFKQINEKTKEYEGIQVPVKVIIDKDTKKYEIEVGVPPVSSLIKKELGFVKEKKESGSKSEKEKKEVTLMGNLTMEQCIKIAKMKMKDMLAKDLKSAVKTVIGTAVSMPVTIEGKKPKEILKEIEEGKYDNLFKS
ncbi:MAG: 50S ribosomal protein L11, partial [Candidatus Aenigmatarchaeota archaeon]